ncbi:MAG: OmpH family outer membrane protein [bacterium]
MAYRFLRFVGAMAFAAMLLVPQYASAQSKIGYIDLQRALSMTKEGKSAKDKLQKEFDKKQKELDKVQDTVRKQKESLEANAQMLSDDAKRERAIQLQKDMYGLQQKFIQLQGELSQAEAAATKKIFDKMGPLIEKMGKEMGYDMIVERSAVLYAKPEQDLTDELVKRFDKQ